MRAAGRAKRAAEKARGKAIQITEDRNVEEEAFVNRELAPPPVKLQPPPVPAEFSRTMLDGAGNPNRLDLMPRTDFGNGRVEVGVMMTTPAFRVCIGLNDEDRVAFAMALLNAGPST